jgi:ABC-type glutathione transport system ATPase component
VLGFRATGSAVERVSSALLRVDGLRVEYRPRSGPLRQTQPSLVAARDVSFAIGEGATLGLVGESGSGKTSVARAILGLAPMAGGSVFLNGREFAAPGRVPGRSERRQVQMVFQQPTASLDPRMRVGDSIAEPLRHLVGLRGAAIRQRVEELLVMVGLDASSASRYPRQLSGGQRQRVAIARAIGPSPKLLICDEPTTSLDVSVQAQIINLLTELQTRTRLSLLFISHDLALVRQIASTVAVMYQGEIVQLGSAADVLDRPTHPYARALIQAVPRLESPGRTTQRSIDPEPPRMMLRDAQGA